ncbi:MAG: hypothetical protein ABWK15_08060 [Dissulfuribacterales bacterium]
MPAESINIAVLDIGTQTFRMAVFNVEVSSNGVVRCITPTLSVLRHVRLGEGLERTGLISEAAMTRGLIVLNEFQHVLQKIHDSKVVAVGTQVLRRAKNARCFIGEARQRGFTIDVIGQEQEAELTALGVKYSLFGLTDCCILDIGGGSVEFSTVFEDTWRYVGGAPLGCVSLLDAFPELRPPCQQISDESTDYVTKMLAGRCVAVGDIRCLVVAGGAATALASLALGLDEYQPRKIRGFKMSRDLLTNMWNRLADSYNQKELEKILGNRLDILPAGIFILLRTIDQLDLDEFIVSDSGLLFGLFIKAILKEHLHVEPSNTAGIYI